MARTLKLERPLAVFDIESTGIVPQRDRIVELAVIRIDPDGSIRKTVRRLNPQMPIPAGATAVHGISDADVADAPTFADIAEKLAAFLDGCDLGGYNITGFDIPMLEAEFQRAGGGAGSAGASETENFACTNPRSRSSFETALSSSAILCL